MNLLCHGCPIACQVNEMGFLLRLFGSDQAIREGSKLVGDYESYSSRGMEMEKLGLR